ncbi:uncharacterized protein B0H18DRAFT_959663 [Fomitopsis serialis]|uniref:uncharacterized protein n=1 Tax=Fomitopsis serialis TaxID=139415 RepID=UPI0020072226|nr:uncharacterized protein B0H18DRAFT_959663 [Neoantrodia serialis]KAH9914754.1 hypothetical protein B0H18DRAFT_959663 [Neoantrodia serialis]
MSALSTDTEKIYSTPDLRRASSVKGRIVWHPVVMTAASLSEAAGSRISAQSLLGTLHASYHHTRNHCWTVGQSLQCGSATAMRSAGSCAGRQQPVGIPNPYGTALRAQSAGVTLVLYDHLLNLPREIQYVWQEPPLFLAICVLADVYLREAGLMYIAVEVRPKDVHVALDPPTDTGGHDSNASVHSYILFRLYRIWDDRKFVKYVLGVAFVICMAGTIVSDGYVLKQLTAEVQYVQFHAINQAATCVFPKKSWYLVGSWAGMVAFDLIALAMVTLSSLMTPRRPNTAIVGVLYKQGFLTFLAFLRRFYDYQDYCQPYSDRLRTRYSCHRLRGR